jgi:hypothetical protein
MLAYALEVDFEVAQASQTYDPNWWARVERGELSREQLRALGDQQWGVVKELQIQLRAVKA